MQKNEASTQIPCGLTIHAWKNPFLQKFEGTSLSVLPTKNNRARVKRALCRLNEGEVEMEGRAGERGRLRARFLGMSSMEGYIILCAIYLQNM